MSLHSIFGIYGKESHRGILVKLPNPDECY
jgi:hypothetical protein